MIACRSRTIDNRSRKYAIPSPTRQLVGQLCRRKTLPASLRTQHSHRRRLRRHVAPLLSFFCAQCPVKLFCESLTAVEFEWTFEMWKYVVFGESCFYWNYSLLLLGISFFKLKHEYQVIYSNCIDIVEFVNNHFSEASCKCMYFANGG